MPAEASCQLNAADTGDASDHVLAIRHHQPVALVLSLHTDEPRGTELIDLGGGQAIQMQRDAKAVLLRLLAPADHRRVIAAHLGGSRALRRRAVEVLEDEGICRMAAVVRIQGLDVHTEEVLLWRCQRQVGARPEDDGADVERRICVVRWHKLGVRCHSELHACFEVRFGH